MYFALCEMWHEVPPPAVQLRRIAQVLGIKPDGNPTAPRMASPATTAPSTPQDVAMAASMAGMRAFDGRPVDPMLDLIDL